METKTTKMIRSSYDNLMTLFHQIIIIELYNSIRTEIELIQDDHNKIQEDLLQSEIDDHWDQIKEYISNAYGKFAEGLKKHCEDDG